MEENIEENKLCNSCGRLKTLENFYFRKDRIITPCKECTKKRTKENRVRRQFMVASNLDELKKQLPQEKQCRNCGQIKLITLFSIKDRSTFSYGADCLECYNFKQRQTRQENLERFKEYDKKKYTNHKKEINIKNNKRQKDPEFKKQRNQKDKERRQNDPIYKLRRQFPNYIRAVIKKNGKSFREELPYSPQQLKDHLEAQFEPWMTWENWGRYDPKTWDDNNTVTWTWNIDHKIPISDFDINSMEDQQFKDCWALSNLRPLSSKQNLEDGGQRVRHTKPRKGSI